MSTGFATFTKTLAVVLIVTMCAAMVPSTVHSSGSKCEAERKAKRNAAIALNLGCGIAGFRCAAAILAPNPITIGVCAFSAAGCAYLVYLYVDAWRAYRLYE